MLNTEQCWEAVQKRDAGHDGEFFFGVMTTGVFCKPSCAARLPLRKNVRFYKTPAEAQRDGLRPCLRCRPLTTVGTHPNAERIREACRYIEEHSEDPVNLGDLARITGLSQFHF